MENSINNISEYIPQWLNNLKSETTRRNYLYYFNQFIQKKNFDSFSEIDIEKYFLNHSYSNFSMINQKKAVNSFFNFMEKKNNYCNPVKKINFPSNNDNTINILKIRKRALNNEICNYIIYKLKNNFKNSENLSPELLVFISLLNTGMRVSELLSLELYSSLKDTGEEKYYNYLRLEGNRFFAFLKGKGGKFRYFYINNNVTNFLLKFPMKEGEAIFKNRKGKRLTRYGVYYYFEKIKEKYLSNEDIYKFSPHSLRHTYCTEMSKRNESPINVAKTVGNSVDMIEKVYYQNIKDINKDYYIL
ncbi:MAG TPA: hypothetical protein DC049_18605 [Spirochaetia bacterium]|nr:hypothetical protein [Spirochaetia bacterium]